MGTGKTVENAGQVSDEEAGRVHRATCRAYGLNPNTTTPAKLAELLAQGLTTKAVLEHRMLTRVRGTHRRGITTNPRSF